MHSIYDELKIAKRFQSTNEELPVALLLTSERLREYINRLCHSFDITVQQYNMLRILCGSYPRALSCSEINSRMIQRSPDITRMLSRLELQGYVMRKKDERDNRVVLTEISSDGVSLIESMETSFANLEQIFDVVSEDERQSAIRFLGRVRRELNKILDRG